MNRTLRALLVVGVCLLAFGLAAATITNPSAAGFGGGGGPTVGGGGGGGLFGHHNASGAGGGGPPVPRGTCVPTLVTWQFKLGVLLAVAVVALLLARRYSWLVPVAVFGVLLAPALVAYALLTDCGARSSLAGSPPVKPPNLSSPLPFSGNGSGGGGAASAATSPPALALVVIAAVVVLVLVALYATGDSDEAEPEEPDAEADEETLADVGRAAGAAADRIDDVEGDVENEVYRAWREMTDLLDVPNPASSTPGEFAAAAREAGMDAEHVDALTDVFRDVRYGGREADAARERRARDALRAIEDAYGADAGADADERGDGQ